ncbi:hypothetical protein Q5741_18870 [Paenibacillus sp. JX-17]|uniref:Uncharacterized protein n=1 Tax=Paenibacillus lacisoli TaxID=3064525 RepID=A0ABT9CGT5_9BACL|nr:hypothetical protein [Paenibacillus sp. JX-17]MDO7908467.1 hypothetical protein [Paenibacillus sp. JX-17]
MDRKQLIADAVQAGKHARHNLQVIRLNPEKMLPGKIGEAEAYLITMKQFAEQEIKNARREGRTLHLRTRLKGLVLSIVSSHRMERKGETV